LGFKSPHLHQTLIKKPLINNQIRARRVRVIGEEGRQLGIFELEKALFLAKEKGLDLIQITEKVDPPVCKIGDYGKYLYNLEKKERLKKIKSVGGKIKNVRLRFNISTHDMETKSRQAEKFLKKGYKLRIEMLLRGREKAHGDLAKEKINSFLEELKKLSPLKIERELKREPRGYTIIVSAS